MWLVDNRTPYAADRTWRQDKEGNKIWMVVVKATFDLRAGGEPRLADEQVPVSIAAQPWGEAGATSLAYEADLFGLKACTDILVNGSAWAPRGRRAQTLDVRLSAGSVKKSLRVFGDRRWRRNVIGALAASEPEWFDSIPFRYERAYGGADLQADDASQHRIEARNPIGAGFAVRADSCLDQLLPNFEYPDALISSWKDQPPPAGLNAVDCSWSPRRELAGTYDDAWRESRFPLWAEDFSTRYNNCAPADQQTDGFLRGGEPVELLNLSADGRLAFSLPKIYPVFQTCFGRDRQEHRGQLCTVLIEPDAQRLVMAWQTSLVCNHRVDELDSTIVTQKTLGALG